MSIEILKRLLACFAGFLGSVPPTFALNVYNGLTGFVVGGNRGEIDARQTLTFFAVQKTV
jgi:hypothetical protein